MYTRGMKLYNTVIQNGSKSTLVKLLKVSCILEAKWRSKQDYKQDQRFEHSICMTFLLFKMRKLFLLFKMRK